MHSHTLQHWRALAGNYRDHSMWNAQTPDSCSLRIFTNELHYVQFFKFFIYQNHEDMLLPLPYNRNNSFYLVSLFNNTECLLYPRMPELSNMKWRETVQASGDSEAASTHAFTPCSPREGWWVSAALCLRPRLPWWLSSKGPACQHRRCGLNPWAGKMPWRRKWIPIPVLLPEKCHGQRSLVG